MLNTVAFIESIEPDFSYQGLEGAMSLVVENAENFAIINDVIDEGADIAEEDVFTEGVVGSAAKYVRKAIEWIIKNIKKAIAKLKALFLSLVHKLKMAYLSAMRSIGKFAAKNLTSKHGGTVKVKWFKLKAGEFETKCDSIASEIEAKVAANTADILKGKFAAVSNGDASGVDDALYAKDKFNAGKELKAKIKALTVGAKGEDGKRSGGELFEAMETANADSASLKALYEKALVKSVNKVYKTMMKTNDKLLKAAHQAEKAINDTVKGETKFGKNEKKHISTAKLMIKGINAVVSKAISENSMLFSAVYRTSVFALHQAIKATVYAMKRAAMGDDAYKYDKKAAKERAKGAAAPAKAEEPAQQESAEIEDILA